MTMKQVRVLAVFSLLVTTLAFAADPRDITVESVIAEMNRHRALHGVAPLQSEERLMRAADDRVSDMEQHEYWAHVSPDGRKPFTWITSRGYKHAYAGENLASGFETVGVLVEAWMESPGHRANILSPLYNEVGISIIEGSTTGRASGKSVVVLFARHQVTAQPQRAAR